MDREYWGNLWEVVKKTSAEWSLAFFFGFLSVGVAFLYPLLDKVDGYSFSAIFSSLSVNGDFAVASVGIFGPIIASVLVTPPPRFRLALSSLSIVLTCLSIFLYTVSFGNDGGNKFFYNFFSVVILFSAGGLMFLYYFVQHRTVNPAERQRKSSKDFKSNYLREKGRGADNV